MASDVKYVRYHMFALKKYIEEESDNALLQWSTRLGFPRITVYTSPTWYVNGKMDRSKIISAPMDNLNAMLVLKFIEQAVNSKEEVTYTVDCYNNIWRDGVMTDMKKLACKIQIGKDKNLINYIGLIEDEKRKIKFPILPSSKYIKYHDKDGNEITNTAIVSDLFGKVYVESLSKVLAEEMAKYATKTLDERVGEPMAARPVLKLKDKLPSTEIDELLG